MRVPFASLGKIVTLIQPFTASTMVYFVGMTARTLMNFNLSLKSIRSIQSQMIREKCFWNIKENFRMVNITGTVF